MMEPFTATRTRFMDEGMRELWNRMSELPGELRLYGGTALALYLDHRVSTDFDFATPQPAVDLDLARRIPWLSGARLSGGAGMVDATIECGRPIRVTLMETGAMVPDPEEAPIRAPNGVMVAHPKDLVRAKLEACLTRDAARDFIDVAHCARVWPKLTRDAIETHIERSGRTRQAVSGTLGDPPPSARAGINAPRRETLQELAQEVHRGARAQGRSQGGGWEL